MAQIDYIKHLYEQGGKSFREIAKIVGKSFRTVQKYACKNNFSPKTGPNVKAKIYPVLESHIPTIDEWMTVDVMKPQR